MHNVMHSWGPKQGVLPVITSICGFLGCVVAEPPEADIDERDWRVRFVPKADILQRGRN
jgi:hypothetical protein